MNIHNIKNHSFYQKSWYYKLFFLFLPMQIKNTVKINSENTRESGRIILCRSTTHRASKKGIIKDVVTDIMLSPFVRKNVNVRNKVKISTSGYNIPIGLLQFRHLFFRTSQENTGIKSYQRITTPQEGHFDLCSLPEKAYHLILFFVL